MPSYFRSCTAIVVCLLSTGGAAAESTDEAATRAPGASPPGSGIALQYIDPDARPQDDFYRHVNGRWLADVAIPADESAYSTFSILAIRTRAQLREIVDGLQGATDPEQRKIADLYASFMNEAALERLGLEPLRAEFARIAALADAEAVAAQIGHFNRIGITAPYAPQIHLDAKDSSKYVADLGQDGLGMPDRDYYLKNDAKLAEVRKQYVRHVEKMLALAGDRDAAREARGIVALETVLASAQSTQVQNRDPVKTYNKVALDGLARLAPAYDWHAYLAQSDLQGRVDYLVISQPTYIAALGRIVRDTPLATWKAYFRWHLVSDLAPYLGHDFVDEDFAFNGTVVRGTQAQLPRWRRGIDLLNHAVGESLGKLYVARHFAPEATQRMNRLVQNLLAAYQADIETLAWMSPETRRRALEKLAKFTTKIGYPARWRDYGGLQIARDDLVGNVLRARAFEVDRNLAKLGQPVDHTEWLMAPQAVDAYYDPEKNEIVFPAGILQPPFFDVDADDAVNYGAIGGVIGHEISHGFDDQGSQYDGDGNLLGPPGWFTQADLERYKARTHALVAQYAAHAPIPGYPVNGELTLGENIADNSGLAIAYKAYRRALGERKAPVIDNLSGDQRFFMGWAQIWRAKVRENYAIVLIKTDPHAPYDLRGLLPAQNLAPFYEAFDIKAGDRMYLKPEDRVTIW